MTRSELIDALTERFPMLTKAQVVAATKALFDAMESTLATGERIEIRGFGSFAANVRTARIGRNPKSGARVEIPEKRAVRFKMGLEMRERLEAAYRAEKGE